MHDYAFEIILHTTLIATYTTANYYYLILVNVYSFTKQHWPKIL